MGPRQTMSGFRSSQAKERTQADGEAPRRRSRWTSGLALYQSSVADMSSVSGLGGSVAPGLVELALRAGHRGGLVVAEQEVEVLPQDLAEVGGHDQRGDRPEGEPLLGVHQLLLVAAVEGGLLLLQPLGG